ncbi:unnamed protein product, partial [Rangifer tarandus platyrhynchus]
PPDTPGKGKTDTSSTTSPFNASDPSAWKAGTSVYGTRHTASGSSALTTISETEAGTAQAGDSADTSEGERGDSDSPGGEHRSCASGTVYGKVPNGCRPAALFLEHSKECKNNRRRKEDGAERSPEGKSKEACLWARRARRNRHLQQRKEMNMESTPVPVTHSNSSTPIIHNAGPAMCPAASHPTGRVTAPAAASPRI